MIVFLPVSRYKIEYQVAAGRPYSRFERLLLEAVASEQEGNSLDVLHRTFHVHRRVVIEGLVTLMQAGWIAIRATTDARQGFVMTTAGQQALGNPNELPKNISVFKRTGFVVGERVEGQLARGGDIRFSTRAELAPHWDAGVAIPKGRIPHPVEEGLVLPLLRRYPGEWIRACDSIDIVRDSADFVLADVDTNNQVITGVPQEWIPLLRDELLERVRQREKRLAIEGKSPEDHALRKFVRQVGPVVANDPDEWLLAPDAGRIIAGSDEHHAILEDRLANARSYVAIVSGRLDLRTVEQLAEPLRAAVRRGVLVDILWGIEPSTSERSAHKAALDVLKKLDWDSHQAVGFGRLSVGKDPSRSHAKFIISDAGEEFEAIVGSYDWLAGNDGAPRIDISIVLREGGPVGRLCRILADLSAKDPRLATGAGVIRLRNAAANLDRRLAEDEARNVTGHVESAPNDKTPAGLIRARLVIGRKHNAVLDALAKKTTRRLVVASHVLGRGSEAAFNVLRTALQQRACPNVEVLYGVRNGSSVDEQRAASEFEKLGGVLRCEDRLHAKFAVCDDDVVIITSFNWLSPDWERAQPSSGEIGFVLIGEREGARLLERLGLSDAPPVVPLDYGARREIFLERLAARLKAHDLNYLSATFGRATENLPVWIVVLRVPSEEGVRTIRVELPAEMEPYSDLTCDRVVAQIIARPA